MSSVPAPPTTPQLYLTPQLKKRRDGLAPALLDPSKEATPEDKTSLIRSYRTSSSFLRVSVLSDGENGGIKADDSEEIQVIVDRINSSLKEVTKEKTELASYQFIPQGCMWHVDFRHSGADHYYIKVMCSACSDKHNDGNAYVVETTLVPKDKQKNDAGFKEAKTVFDYVVLQVRKAVVYCEFPEFPEGCKGTPFREIYQLNARVSPPTAFFFAHLNTTTIPRTWFIN